MAKQRKCIVCSKIYEYCPSCNEGETNQWKFIYCSENCRSIFKIFDAFRANKKSSKEAYSELKDLDITRLDNFTNLVKPIIQEIMIEGKPKTTKKKTEDNSQTTPKRRGRKSNAKKADNK